MTIPSRAVKNFTERLNNSAANIHIVQFEAPGPQSFKMFSAPSQLILAKSALQKARNRNSWIRDKSA